MPFYGLGLLTLLVQFACAAHVVRTDRSYVWIVPIVLVPWLGCAAYLLVAVLPDALGSVAGRRFADDVPNITDPGTSYRQKKRDVELVGSAQAKRVFAEECIKRGRFQDAVDLYTSAAQGVQAEDPALLNGLGRAKLLAGDGAGAEAAFATLRKVDPPSFTADAQLDYARALALQDKFDEARAQYEALLRVYPGEEARCRYAVLLDKLGERDRAKELFREIVASVKGAPSYYRSRQREWTNIARRNL